MFCSTNSYVFLLFKESLEMQIVRDRLVPSETGQSFYGLVPVRRRYRGVVGRLNGERIRLTLVIHQLCRRWITKRRTMATWRSSKPKLAQAESSPGKDAQNWCLKMTETIVPSSLGLLTRTAAPPWDRPWLRDVRECSCLLRRHQQAKQP